MKNAILNFTKLLGIIVLSVFLLMVVFQRFLPNESFFGYKIFVIVSESMKPSLDIGDVILTKEVSADSIKVKDVITYDGISDNMRGKIITHQVVKIMEEKVESSGKRQYIFYTQGTNNTIIDSTAVYEKQIHGKLIYKFHIISLISKTIRTTLGLIIFVIIPLSILFVFEIMDIRKELNERRK